MKVCCAVSSLEAGGAERVVVWLANRWVSAGHQVVILTLDGGADAPAYQLDARVTRVGLGLVGESRWLGHGLTMNLRRAAAVRRAIRAHRPDVVIAVNAQTNVLVLVATLGLAVPVVVSERVYPPAYEIGALWSVLRRLTYRRARALVVQTDGIRRWAERLVSRERIHIIPNAVGAPFTDHSSPARREHVVLGVGRLAHQKGFDLLVRAFGALAPRYPEWSLVIVGDGPEREALERLAAAEAPGAPITFAGRVGDPERYYRTAAVFALPSRFEGFPNALLEAMACGCAVVAADVPTGPAEVVRVGIDGILIPPNDVGKLTQGLEQLMAREPERRRLGKAARDVHARFGTDRIGQLWDEVVGVVQHRRRT